jgi:hypothetical protein
MRFLADDLIIGSSSESSLMRIALASFSAFFSIAAFFAASFCPSGFSSSEDSSRAVSLIEGGSFLARDLMGASESESSSGRCLGRFAYMKSD